MGREIKFRAWDSKYKCMDYNFFISNLGGVFGEPEKYYDTPNMEIDEAPSLTVMQYTGADDNNGKNLYEGDIIKSKCYPFYSDAPELYDGKDDPVELNYLGVVGIDVNGVYYDLKVVSNRVSGRVSGGNISDLETFEIIGNIYENPELLKANK